MRQGHTIFFLFFYHYSLFLKILQCVSFSTRFQNKKKSTCYSKPSIKREQATFQTYTAWQHWKRALKYLASMTTLKAINNSKSPSKMSLALVHNKTNRSRKLRKEIKLRKRKASQTQPPQHRGRLPLLRLSPETVSPTLSLSLPSINSNSGGQKLPSRQLPTSCRSSPLVVGANPEAEEEEEERGAELGAGPISHEPRGLRPGGGATGGGARPRRSWRPPAALLQGSRKARDARGGPCAGHPAPRRRLPPERAPRRRGRAVPQRPRAHPPLALRPRLRLSGRALCLQLR